MSDLVVKVDLIVAHARYYIGEANDSNAKEADRFANLNIADVLMTLLPVEYKGTVHYDDLLQCYKESNDNLRGKDKQKSFERGYTGDKKSNKNKSDKRRERNARRKFKENGGLEEDY